MNDVTRLKVAREVASRWEAVPIGDGVNPPVVEYISAAEEKRVFGYETEKRPKKKLSSKPSRNLYRCWRKPQ